MSRKKSIISLAVLVLVGVLVWLTVTNTVQIEQNILCTDGYKASSSNSECVQN